MVPLWCPLDSRRRCRAHCPPRRLRVGRMHSRARCCCVAQPDCAAPFPPHKKNMTLKESHSLPRIFAVWYKSSSLAHLLQYSMYRMETTIETTASAKELRHLCSTSLRQNPDRRPGAGADERGAGMHAAYDAEIASAASAASGASAGGGVARKKMLEQEQRVLRESCSGHAAQRLLQVASHLSWYDGTQFLVALGVRLSTAHTRTYHT